MGFESDSHLLAEIRHLRKEVEKHLTGGAYTDARAFLLDAFLRVGAGRYDEAKYQMAEVRVLLNSRPLG